MHAIDEGVPGGLAKVYPEFAKLAWNHDPVKPSFWEWDGFDPVPEDAHGAEIVPEQVDPGAAGQQEADLTQPLKPLSRAYKHLKFGPGITEVTVAMPHDENLHVDVADEAAQRQREDGGPGEASVHGVLPRGGRRANRRDGAGGQSNTSTFRQMDQDKPIRVVGDEPRLLALRRAR